MEFQKEFQKNMVLSLACKLIVYFIIAYLLVLFIGYLCILLEIFSIDMYPLFVPLMGIFFGAFFLLIFLLFQTKKIQYFGVSKEKIRKKIEKDMQEWKEGAIYLSTIQKSLTKEEYDRHYSKKDSEGKIIDPMEYENIPQRIALCKSNIVITEQKIDYLDSQKEKIGWQYPMSWEWLEMVK
ncbi:TPA: hypothetical protein DCZ39_00265 [Patescibacteria group bacterium]|nr:hypothetical protein [Candidatus Gracilibacteria bacterium]